jgi:hypothetical protein
MPRTLAAVPLSLKEVEQTYPLARALAPELDLETWLAFAQRRIVDSPNSGIVGVRDERGYFYGLLGYLVRHDLTAGTTLEVDMAIAMEVLDRAGTVAVLADEIESIAGRLDCSAIHIHLRPEQHRLRRLLEGGGHSIRSVVLGKLAGLPVAAPD